MISADPKDLEQLSASKLASWGEHASALELMALLNQLPEVQADRDPILDAGISEFIGRIERGEQPSIEEFCERFPARKSSLFHILNIEQILDQEADSLSNGGETVAWPAPGQTLLSFHLLLELGKGSFSRVFLATDASVGDRLVVLKVSQQPTAEAHLLGKLVHRNIVLVHSNQPDPESGLHVICMPYLGSATLLDVLDRWAESDAPPRDARALLQTIQAKTPVEAASYEPAPAADLWKLSYVDVVIRVAIELAEALAFLHTREMFHCDLKPSNVLLGTDGRPRILDFNLSLARRGDGRIRGTLPYMAPEQLRALLSAGAAGPFTIDGRTEVFAFGVILFELLTAQHPFGVARDGLTRQSLVELSAEHQRGATSLRELNPCVDKRFARVLESCLAEDPDRRPQSGVELAAALRRCVTPGQRLCRWAGRHAWKLRSAALVVLLTGGVSAAYWSQREPSSVRQYREGLAAYQRGDYGDAERHFTEALNADAPPADTCFERGRSRLRQEDLQEALADFRNAKERSGDARIRAYIGYCLGRLKQYPEATVYFQQAIQAGHAPAEVFNDLGYAYLKLSQYKDALASLNQAVALNPGLQAGFHNRALVHFHLARKQRLDETGGSIADIEMAIAIGPVTSELLFDAACLYVRAGKPDSALNYLRQALAHGLHPDLLNDPLIEPLHRHPRFGELTQHSISKTSASKAVRLLDPLPDR